MTTFLELRKDFERLHETTDSITSPLWTATFAKYKSRWELFRCLIDLYGDAVWLPSNQFGIAYRISPRKGGLTLSGAILILESGVELDFDDREKLANLLRDGTPTSTNEDWDTSWESSGY